MQSGLVYFGGIAMAFITNFQSPVELDDLIDRYMTDGLTNIDHLFFDAEDEMEWTVDKDAKVGDTVFFMCAKTSVNHMGHVRAQAYETNDHEIIDYAEKEYGLYRKYAGHIVAVGKIGKEPFQSDDSGYAFHYWRSPWYAQIHDLKILDNPVYIGKFRDFITVSRTGAITKLDDEQVAKLTELIKSKNPEY